jgi:hypothetical protein
VNEGGGLVTSPGSSPHVTPDRNRASSRGKRGTTPDGYGAAWAGDSGGGGGDSDDDGDGDFGMDRAAAKEAARDRAQRLAQGHAASSAKRTGGSPDGGSPDGGSPDGGSPDGGSPDGEVRAEAKAEPTIAEAKSSPSSPAAGAKGDDESSSEAKVEAKGDAKAERTAEAKESSGVSIEPCGKRASGNRFRLLGDLPPVIKEGHKLVSLGGPGVTHESRGQEARQALAERLRAKRGSPSKQALGQGPSQQLGDQAKDTDAQPSSALRPSSAQGFGDMPAAYRCDINGHVMKEPVASPHGHTFEAATIKLWLAANGQVCPLTGRPLAPKDLTPNHKLRSELLRWQITSRQQPKRSMAGGGPGGSGGGGDDDDDDDALYDF